MREALFHRNEKVTLASKPINFGLIRGSADDQTFKCPIYGGGLQTSRPSSFNWPPSLKLVSGDLLKVVKRKALLHTTLVNGFNLASPRPQKQHFPPHHRTRHNLFIFNQKFPNRMPRLASFLRFHSRASMKPAYLALGTSWSSSLNSAESSR